MRRSSKRIPTKKFKKQKDSNINDQDLDRKILEIQERLNQQKDVTFHSSHLTIQDQKTNREYKSLGYNSQKALENYENHKIEWKNIMNRVKQKTDKNTSVMDKENTIQLQLRNIEK